MEGDATLAKELRKAHPMMVVDPKEGTVKLLTEGIEELEARDQTAFDKANPPKCMSASTAVKVHYIETGDMLTEKQLDALNQEAFDFDKAKKPKITRRSHKRPTYQNNRRQRVLREITDYQGIIYTELDGMERYDYRFWGPAEYLEQLTNTSTYQEFKDRGIDFIVTHNKQGYWMRRKLKQFESTLVDSKKFIKKEKLT